MLHAEIEYTKHPYMLLYPMAMVVAPTPTPITAVAVAAPSAVVSTAEIQPSAHTNITEDDYWLI